ncbi:MULTISPECIES: capsular polysaccharide synthesis protein [Bacteria]|nr:capsular polysaccharide synthesis protein [uncultured Streptococcus sp.]
MRKIGKVINEYFVLRKSFTPAIARNKLFEKFWGRIGNYKIFNNIASDFYQYKHETIINFLEKDFSQFLKSYNFKEVSHKEIEQRKIFSMWIQGYESAPKLVQKTIDSQRKYAEKYGYKFIFLDKNNIQAYVTLPSKIVEKYENGIIDFTRYSDIVRVALLSKYGGIWLDSTIYVDSSRELDYLKKEFYTIRAKANEGVPKYVANGRWSSFCLSGEKQSVVFDFLEKFHVAYFMKYDIVLDYFLLDYIIELGYRTNDLIRNYIDRVEENNQKLFFLADNFSNQYDEKEWAGVLSTTALFKCSYKCPINEATGTYFDRLVKGEL